MSDSLPWVLGHPSAGWVAEHASAHPVTLPPDVPLAGGHGDTAEAPPVPPPVAGPRYGLWLRGSVSRVLPELVPLAVGNAGAVVTVGGAALAEQEAGERWLPVTAEGIPVVLLPVTRPGRRVCHTFAAKVGQHKIHLSVDEIAGRRPIAVAIEMHKEGSAFRAIMSALARAVSYGLERGVPLQVYLDDWQGTRFEPDGATDDPDVPTATSLLDWMARTLRAAYK